MIVSRGKHQSSTTARSKALPDVPPLGEFVPGYESGGCFGLKAHQSNLKRSLIGSEYEPIRRQSAILGLRYRRCFLAANVAYALERDDIAPSLRAELTRW